MADWQTKKLCELSKNKKDIVSGPFGSNLKVSDYIATGAPILRLQNIGKGIFIDKDIKYISKEKAEELKSHSFMSGDIVLAKLGIPIGKTCFVPKHFKSGIITADVVRIRVNTDIIDYKYLEFFLNSDNVVNQLTSNISGATRPRVNLSDVRNIKVSFPSLYEQKRIVKILDVAFANLETSKINAEKNLKNAKELFESYLQNIFEAGGEDWEEKKIENISKIINGYAFSSKDFQSSNSVKSIKITNVGVKKFIEKANNYLPEKFKDIYKSVQIKEGNIVIALTRTIISSGLKVAVVPRSYDSALLNQRVAGLITNEKIINKNYLYYYLTSNRVIKYVLAHVNTLMQPNLSINDLKKMPVPIPPTLIQQKIVTKLDHLSAKTRKLEKIYQQKLSNLEELKKSILQKAFAGEL